MLTLEQARYLWTKGLKKVDQAKPTVPGAPSKGELTPTTIPDPTKFDSANLTPAALFKPAEKHYEEYPMENRKRMENRPGDKNGLSDKQLISAMDHFTGKGWGTVKVWDDIAAADENKENHPPKNTTKRLAYNKESGTF